ncbi:hypothetical protein C1646_771822 [Rhizophagus diaphanus]|nr:hypothetical protein C1646_771822 [Rhizophagus diaphanus] [Rhizophagus sp. MUCL 43196]
MTKCTLASKIADHESDDKWAGIENQKSSVNTEATTVDEINIGPIGNTQSREKSSISESERPSFVNLKNLGYNILKNLDDETVGDIEFPELDSCPSQGVLIPHFACPGCGKNVDILDQADALSIVSNLPIPDPKVTSQSSGISPLSNLMETFTLSSPPIQMEGIEGIVTQQVKSALRCAKYSEELFSSFPPLGFLQISPQPQEQSSSTAQKKRSSEFASEKDSMKQTRKQIDRNDSPTLKKLIMELTSPESLEDGLSRDPLITLQLSVSDMDVNSLDFLNLYNKIGTAKDNLRRTTHDLLRCYYIFGQATKQLFDHFRKTYNEDVSNAKINDRIMNQISVQDKLTKTNL